MNLGSEGEEILERLGAAHRAGRLAHAYLIAGRAGGEAGELAHRILEMLYCSGGAAAPCGACAGCLMARRHSHPDMLWLEPQQKSRLIRMETVRAAQEHVSYTSPDGRVKAVVLAEAERMTADTANTLLKTIEEPPGNSLFLLLSDSPEALLPTVISRCQKLSAGGREAEYDAALLGAAARAMAAAGEGGALAAFYGARIMLDLLETRRATIEKEEKAAAGGMEDADPQMREEIKRMTASRMELRCRADACAALKCLQAWHRDVLASIAGAGATALFKEHAAEIGGAAKTLTFADAANNINAVEHMKEELDRNMALAHIFENGFLHFASGRGAAARGKRAAPAGARA